MTDTPQENTGAASQQSQKPMLLVQHQYIKDLSFESPRSPAIFQEMVQEKPTVDLVVRVGTHRLQDSLFEVVLHFEAKAMVTDTPGFVLELAYGAIAEVHPQEPDHLPLLLEIEAPRLMFPFARNIIADVTRDGAFPPLMIHPIDFADLFRKKQADIAAAQAETKKEDALVEA